MNTFSQKVNVSYKTVQRLITKLKSNSNIDCNQYLLMFNNPNKNFISELFIDKENRKKLNKGLIFSNNDFIFDVIKNKELDYNISIDNLNKEVVNPIYDDITVLRNDEYFSNQQKEYTVFYGENKWQTFNNFHLELEMDQNAIDLFMRGFLLKLRKESIDLTFEDLISDDFDIKSEVKDYIILTEEQYKLKCFGEERQKPRTDVKLKVEIKNDELFNFN